jgi:energy-coupling factor transport system permease protein
VLTGFTAGRRVRRTRYRPDVWAAPEWLTALSGLAVAVTFQWAVHDALGAGPPLAWPQLHLVAFGTVLLGLLPAVLTPPLPDSIQ